MAQTTTAANFQGNITMSFPQTRSILLLSIFCIFQIVFADANLGQTSDNFINRDRSNERPSSQRKPLKIIENIPYADTDNPRQQIDLFFRVNEQMTSLYQLLRLFMEVDGERVMSQWLNFIGPIVQRERHWCVNRLSLTDEAIWSPDT